MSQKEEKDKRLLKLEIVIGVASFIIFFALLIFGILGYAFWELPMWALIMMMAIGLVVFLTTVAFALRIEQKAGYYECQECGHRYVPTYKQVLLARHINRKRYMKCPKCGKKTYNKKVISNKE